jgi:hypothetical protein
LKSENLAASTIFLLLGLVLVESQQRFYRLVTASLSEY